MATSEICTAIEAQLDTNVSGRSTRSAQVFVDIGTATATNPSTTTGAATISKPGGIVTTNVDVNSAAAGTYTLTLTNTMISASSMLMVGVGYGTATAGYPIVSKVTPGSGTATIVITNAAPVAAFNGSLIIRFMLYRTLAEIS